MQKEMPQEFQVLQCYKCETFQVHQVKKSNKWNCKLCGEKQSVIKVFGRGTGADCRHHVQRLNQLRGDIITVKEQIHTFSNQTQNESSDQPQCDRQVQDSSTDSKWRQFLSNPEVSNTDSEDNEDDEEFTTDKEKFLAAKKMKRKRKYNDSMLNPFCKRQNVNTVDDYHDNNEYEDVSFPDHSSQLKNDKMFNRTETGEPWNSNQSNNLKKNCKTTSKWGQYVDDEDSSSTEEDIEKICNKEFDNTGRYQNNINDKKQNTQLDDIENISAEKRGNKIPGIFVYNSKIERTSTLDRSAVLNNSDTKIIRKCEIPSRSENKNINIGLNISRQLKPCQNTTENLSVKSADMTQNLSIKSAKNMSVKSVNTGNIFYTGDITEADLDFDI